MRTRLFFAGLAVVAGVAVVSSGALAAGGRANATCSGSVAVGGHSYLVVTAQFSCAAARRYVRTLAAEKPIGPHTALSVGKLAGGPAGYSCGASGYPQRIGRCFKGSLGFTWVKQH